MTIYSFPNFEPLIPWGLPVAQVGKNLSAIQETRIQSSLGFEYPLEKGMLTHSSILAWKIPWKNKPTVYGVSKSQTQMSN